MKKRVFSLLIAVAMILSLVPIVGITAEESEEEPVQATSFNFSSQGMANTSYAIFFIAIAI